MSRLLDRETFRFKDKDDQEYEIWLEVSSRLLKIQTSQKASFYHFSLENLALLTLVKVIRSPNRKNDKTSDINWYMYLVSPPGRSPENS